MRWKTELNELTTQMYAPRGGRKALAEVLGITPKFLRQILKGRQKPGYELVQRIHKAWHEMMVDAYDE